MLSSALVRLRNIPDVGERSKEVTETLAMGQSPMMPLGISPGLAMGYESASHGIRFHKCHVWQVSVGTSRPGNEKMHLSTLLL